MKYKTTLEFFKPTKYIKTEQSYFSSGENKVFKDKKYFYRVNIHSQNEVFLLKSFENDKSLIAYYEDKFIKIALIKGKQKKNFKLVVKKDSKILLSNAYSYSYEIPYHERTEKELLNSIEKDLIIVNKTEFLNYKKYKVLESLE